jgi:hypothetical protein
MVQRGLSGGCGVLVAVSRVPVVVPAVALPLIVLVLAGCATSGEEAPAAGAPATVSVSGAGFPTGAPVDYQLGGAYDTPAGVGIVARDSTEQPASGVWSICYVNGFQTQPGEAERWDDDLLLHDAGGDVVADPAWPDENLLDTSTADKRDRIAAILGDDIARCASSGFDAVEIDNLDSFTRADGLTLEGNMALAALYASRAQSLGLKIGQKNSAEYASTLRTDVGFDFAVAEECVSFGECAAYTDVYGDAVIDIEYADDPSVTLDSICADPARPASTVYRDRDLLTPASPDYVYAHC